MISVPGFRKNVFEITNDEVKVPAKVKDTTKTPTTKPSYRYEAPSTSVLAVSTDENIEIVAGRLVSEQTLKNVLGFGIKSKKPLVILRCEVLGNLREVDRMITLCNDIIKSQSGLLEDYLLDNEDDIE